MTVEEIIQNLAALNAANPQTKKAKKKPPAPAAPAAKPNGHTELSQEELLVLTVQRIVTALGLEKRGVTTQSLVEQVRRYEEPHRGVFQ